MAPQLRFGAKSTRFSTFVMMDAGLALRRAERHVAQRTSCSLTFASVRPSGRQAGLEKTCLVALAVYYALVVLGGEVGGH